MRIYDSREQLREDLKKPSFRRAYDALQEEFAVARQVIELRLGRGLTQQQLAVRAHTSQSCIARLESGAYRNLSLSFLRRVGEALGAEPQVSFRRRTAKPRLRRGRTLRSVRSPVR
jgi:transcriptional regulator with XRE-family HTH domain